MKLLLPLLIQGCLLAKTVTAITDLLRFDCDGGLHLFSETHFEAHFNLESVVKTLNFVFQESLERAKCDCPQMTEAEMQRRFLPTLEALTCSALHLPDGNGGYKINPCTTESACNLSSSSIPTGFSNHNSWLKAMELEGAFLPETCTYETVTSGKGCKLAIKGDNENISFLKEGTTLDIQAFSCGVGTVLPSLSIRCEGGAGCEELFIKECTTENTDSDLGPLCRKFWGSTLEERRQVLTLLGVAPEGTPDRCLENELPSFPWEYRTAFLQYVAKFLPESLAQAVSGDFLVSGPTALEWVQMLTNFEDNFGQVLSVVLPLPEEPVVNVETVLSDVADRAPKGFDVEACEQMGCHASYLLNGECNPACNVKECLFDMQECDSCPCVAGTDSRSCQSSALRDGVGDVVNADTCSELEVFECSVDGGPNLESAYEWVCAGNFEPQPRDNLLGYSSTECPVGDSSSALIRNCWCGRNGLVGQGNPCAYAYAFRSLTPEVDCPGPPPPTVCPMTISTSDVRGVLSANTLPDRKNSGLAKPDLAPEYNNVFFLTCQGSFGFNLFNRNLGVTAEIPNLPHLVQAFEQAFLPLYKCLSNDVTNPNAFTMRYQLFRAELWLESLIKGSGNSVGLDANSDGMAAYQTGTAIDVASHWVQPWRSFFFQNDVRGRLLGATFSLNQFVDEGFVRGNFKGFGSLLDYDAEVQLEIKDCENKVLSQVAVAVNSPFNELWRNAIPCNNDNDCGGDTVCIDYAVSHEDPSRWDFQPAFSSDNPMNLDQPFSGIIFGDGPPPNRCVNNNTMKQTYLSANKFMETIVAGREFNENEASFKSQFKRCGQSVEKLFQEPVFIYLCGGEVQYPDYDQCLQNCIDLSCESLPQPIPYDNWISNILQANEDETEAFMDVQEWSELTTTVPFVEVPAPAPIISSISWGENFDRLYISFEEFTNQRGLEGNGVEPCANFIEFLGDTSLAHVCVWLLPTRLEVQFPSDSTLPLEGSIRFKASNNIRNKEQTSYPLSTVARAIDRAPVASEFVVKLAVDAPDSVANCQNELPVSSTALFGGGRPLQNVMWEISERFDTPECGSGCLAEVSWFEIPDVTEINGVLDFTEIRNAFISLQSGFYYLLRVRASNWVSGEITTAERFFFLNEAPQVLVTVAGGSTATVFRSTDIAVRASSLLPATCYAPGSGSGEGYSYTWSLLCGEEQVSPPGSRLSGAQLFVPRASLPKANCEATVTVTSPAGVSGSAIQQWTVTDSPLVALVAGGNARRVLSSEKVVLDASKSCNPNVDAQCSSALGNLRQGEVEPEPELVFTWRCTGTDAADQALTCPTYDPNTAIVALDPGALAGGATYEFTVDVADSRVLGPAASATVTVNVVSASVEAQVSCERPSVSIGPVPSVVNAVESGLVLRGKFGGTPSTVEKVEPIWNTVLDGALAPAAPFAGENPVNRKDLVVAPGTLAGGAQYKFRLTATLDCLVTDARPFAEVSFAVNRPPSGGVTTVSPRSGQAISTKFALTASQFTDDNLPLQYAFFFRFVDPGTSQASPGKFAIARKPSQLTPFSLSSTASSALGAGEVEVFAVAQDNLGARSPPTGARTVVFAKPPFAGNSTNIELDVLGVLDSVRLSGGKEEDVLRTALSIASVANTIGPDAVSPVAVEWSRAARSSLIQAVAATRGALGEDPDTSPQTLALEASALAVVLNQPASVGQADRDVAIEVAKALLADARTKLLDLAEGEEDPNSGSLLPNSFAADTLVALSLLAESVKSSLDNTTATVTEPAPAAMPGRAKRRLRRGLQETEKEEASQAVVAACDSLFEIRAALEGLPFVTLAQSTPGQIGDQLDGGVVRLKAAREESNTIGGDRGLQELNIDDGLNTTAPALRLPRNLLDSKYINRTSPEQVNVVLLQWAFNVRCDNVSSTFGEIFGEEAPLDTGLDECGEEDLERLNTFRGPLTEIENVVSVEFINSDDPSDKLTVEGLEDDFVQIRIPLPDFLLTGDSFCGDETAPSCGFYLEDVGWTGAGCNVSYLDPEEGYMVCQCNHASDYSAWQSFVKDLENTLFSPIAITALGLLVIGALFPVLLVIWVLLACWSRKSDLKQSDHLQRGALVMMLLTKVQNQHRQREFFQRLKLLRDGKLETEEKQTTAKKPALLMKSNESMVMSATRDVKRKVHVFKNWLMALRYDHSIFGLVRFDPHYTRLQRVCVMMAVIVGNLFVSALFFQLKNEDDTTTEFLVGVTIASAMLISIPIRFMVKVLFRGSAPKQGSKMERVAHMYRMTESHSDDVRKEDMRLVLAYRDLYRAKLKLNRLHSEEETLGVKNGSMLRTLSTKLLKQSEKGSSMKLAVPKIDLEKNAKGGYTQSSDSDEDDVSPSLTASDDNLTTTAQAKKGPYRDLISVRKDITETETEYRLAKSNLIEATNAAKDAWSKNTPPSQRKLAVQRQKSMLLKIAAVMGETEEPLRARSRNPMFHRVAVYIGWVLLSGFYFVSIFYSVRFVLTRKNVSAEQLGDKATEEAVLESERFFITTWLMTAATGVLVGYLVLEPIMQFIRFSCLPWFLVKFGTDNMVKKVNQDGSIRFEHIEKLQVNTAGTVLESTTDFALDFAVEVIEGLF